MPSVSPVRRIIDEALNQGNLGMIEELVSPASPGIAEALHTWITAYRVAFPDLRCAIVDEVRQGDRIAAHWTLRGTHNGPYLGNPPTNRPVEMSAVINARLDEGNLADVQVLIDRLSLLQQMGLVP